MTEGIQSIMVDTAAGQEMYIESQEVESSFDGTVSNIPSIFFNIFSPLAYLLFFYYLTMEKRHRWAEIGFGLCILIKSFYSLSNGQRTEVTMSVINIFVAYIALKPMLSQQVRKWVRGILVLLAISITIPFVAHQKGQFPVWIDESP